MVRHKNRYLIVEVNETKNTNEVPLRLGPAAIYNAVMKMVQQLHGDFGVAAIRAGFTTKYCNEKTRIVIIRSRHGPHKFVLSAVPFINSVENRKVTLRSLYMGATIRQCVRFLKKYQQRNFDEMCGSLNTDEERAVLKEALLNFDAVLEMG